MPDFYIFNFFPVLILEILGLKILRWGSWLQCFLDALVINFASFTCLMLGIGPSIMSARLVGLTLFYTHSFIIECFILCLLERHEFKKVLYVTASANLISLLYLFFDTQKL